MKQKSAIIYWDRSTKRYETEKVYGENFVRWLYEGQLGQSLTEILLAKPILSHLYGLYQSSALSQKKIDSFIKNFNINWHEYSDGPFASFNDFFIRKFKPGARKFVSDTDRMAAPCEGRYLGFEKMTDEQTFPVKGTFLRAQDILGNQDNAAVFANGPLIICRLCPTDYHRFHFPDEGKILDSYRVHGQLHSVNPLALKYHGEIFITNERNITLMDTRNFGKLAYVEVGAMMVGRIVQTYEPNIIVKRGQEKGYFLFGGSTVILLGEPGRWKPEADILDQTAKSRETLVRLGEPIAQC